MRDAVIERQKELDRGLRKAIELAIETGELSPKADAQQIAFDFTGLILALSRAEMVLGHEEAQRRAREAFERLIRSNAA